MKTCKWTKMMNDEYKIGCLDTDRKKGDQRPATLKNNSFKYCPYCGGKIETQEEKFEIHCEDNAKVWHLVTPLSFEMVELEIDSDDIWHPIVKAEIEAINETLNKHMKELKSLVKKKKKKLKLCEKCKTIMNPGRNCVKGSDMCEECEEQLVERQRVE